MRKRRRQQSLERRWRQPPGERCSAAAHRTAILCSLVQTCKHLQINPFVYLRAGWWLYRRPAGCATAACVPPTQRRTRLFFWLSVAGFLAATFSPYLITI